MTDLLPPELLLKLTWGVSSFFSQKELISYVNFTAALVVMSLCFLVARPRGSNVGLLRFLFPAELWNHASARLDIRLYLLIQPIMILAILPALGLIQSASTVIGWQLTDWFGASALNAGPVWGRIIYTLVVFVCVDFGFFYSHYLTHKHPLLWCFHKVHHSAEVLVPFTALRFHPLDILWNVLFSVSFVAVFGGACRYLFYPEATQLQLFGNNVLIGLSYLTTHNLRHSHVWLHYPAWLARWLISPAQHHIHHSKETRHWDKNFGYLLPFWDRWFGTYYAPEGYETFALGVAGMPSTGIRSHQSIGSLLSAPFMEAWEHWKARSKP